MADQMVWPPCLSHDRKWLRVAKCTHPLALAVGHTPCFRKKTSTHIIGYKL